MTGEAPDMREQEDCPSGVDCDWSCDQHRHPLTESIEALIERSSLGTPEAKAARESTDPQVARLVVRLSQVMEERDKARAEADRLRVTLAAVAERLDEWSDWHEDSLSRLQVIAVFRAILSADPVSLADVRDVRGIVTEQAKAHGLRTDEDHHTIGCSCGLICDWQQQAEHLASKIAEAVSDRG